MISLDPERQFEELKKKVISRMKETLEVEGKNYSVEVDNVWIDDNLDVQNIAEQKIAKDTNKTWAVPVFASLKIKDLEGKTIVQTKKMKLMDVPKMTVRQGFIVDGTEYQVANQWRLKPGVYTRTLQTGEVASQVNLAKGMNFKVSLDPKTGVYSAQFGGIGGTKAKLYSLLKVLDAPEAKIQSSFGDLYKKNLVADISPDIKKIYKTLFYDEPEDENEAVDRLRTYFKESKIDPETTKLTLGTAHKSVTDDLMFDTARKLLAVNKGLEPTDNRESLQFKKLMTVEDILDDRLRLFRPKIQMNIKRRLGGTREIKDVRSIIQPEKINKVVKSLFNTSDLSMTPEQINPVNMLNTANKTTVLGEGGIGTRHAIVLEQRDIDPSHFGFLDPIHSPEGPDIGTTLHLTTAIDKKGDKVTTQVYNVKTKKLDRLTPQQMHEAKVAFPGQYDKNFKATKKTITVMYQGEMQTFAPSKIEYIVPSAVHMFSLSTNLVPFMSSDQGARTEMAAKMIEQALPLVDPDIPYVQSRVREDSDKTFEQLIGETTATQAPLSGTISKVTEDSIYIKPPTGKVKKVYLYNNFALNSNTYLHSKPLVKSGDKVRKGQVIADSNYTKNGTLAMGKNLRVGYLTYKGYNHEDGIVISESAAKKTTSPHLERVEEDLLPTDLQNKKKFDVYYPQTLTKEQMANLDDQGVIKPGTMVQTGDTLFTLLRKQELTEDDELLGKISKTLKKPYRAVTSIWTKEDPGEVVEVIKNPKGISIRVRVDKTTKLGDKFAGRHGNKGVVTRIIPDNEMPQTEDGKPLEMLLNPIGVPSRTNAGQLLETAAGKMSEYVGKNYIVTNFERTDQLKKIQKEMAKLGLVDTEKVIDPVSGKVLGDVMVGRQFIMKLNHPTEKKFAARSTGSYTADLTPGRGGGQGGQSVDPLTTFSLLAHGAKHNLRDIAVIKSQKNDEFWRALQLKEPLPAPRPTFAYEKQIALMKQLGVNVEKKGSKLQLVPISDKDIKQMSSGQISSGKMLLAKNLKPEQGGLFDRIKTGGMRGEKWSHIALTEEMPHPMFEDAIKSISGMTTSNFNRLINGTIHVDKDGEWNEDKRGKTGAAAMKQILSAVKLQEEFDRTVEHAKKVKGTALNKDNQKIRFLKNLIDQKLDTNIYFTKVVPVLPPIYRPIYPRPDGNLITSPINHLYKDTIDINEQLSALKELPDEEKEELRKDLYGALKAVVGLGSSLTNPEYTGVIDIIKGKNQPKHGFFQSKLVSKRQDLTGRSTITLDPTQDIDEVGIPEDMLYKIFEPFVVQEMKNFGVGPLESKELIAERDGRASQALDKAIAKRTVLLNRAPSLHKHSVMAMKPVRSTGRSIKMHPLTLKGYNADLDGDCFNSFVYIDLRRSNLNQHKESSNNLKKQLLSSNASDTIPDGEGAIVPLDNSGVVDMRYDGNVVVKLAEGVHRIHISEMPHLPETKRITDSGNEEYDVPEGVYMFSHANGDEKVTLRPVTKWSVHKNLGMVEVKTRKKRKAEVSNDHSLYCINTETLECEKVLPKNSEKKKTPCPAFIEVPEVDRLFELDTSEYTIAKVYNNANARARGLKETTSLNKSFGYLLGCHVGDGWVDWSTVVQKGKVHLANIEPNITEGWLKSAAALLTGPTIVHGKIEAPHEFNGHQCYSEKHTISSVGLSKFLYDTCGHGAASKHLPAFFLAAPEEFRFAMLAGLLDTDGSVQKVKAKSKKAHTFTIAYDTKSEQLADDIRLLLTSLRIRSSKTEYTKEGEDYYKVNIFSIDTQTYASQIPLQHEEKKSVLRELSIHQWTDYAVIERHDIVPIPDTLKKEIRKTIGHPRNCSKEQHTLYSQLSKKDDHITRACAFKCVDLLGTKSISEMPLGEKWLSIVRNQDIHWDVIDKVTPLKGAHTAWDVTIPDAWTFMTADQIIIYDTMSVHVPISTEALEESFRMLPSKNLFNSSGELMSEPRQEAQLGLYLLTKPGKKTNKKYKDIKEAVSAYQGGKILDTDQIKVGNSNTTIGKILVNSLLPANAKKDSIFLTGSATKDLLTDVAKNNPFLAPSLLDKFKDLGFQTAYEKGFTISLKDLEYDREKVEKTYAPFMKKAREIRGTEKNREKREQKLIQLFSKADSDIAAELKKTLSENNSLKEMAVSGAKGNWGQIKQLVAAPGLVSQVGGNAFPYAIKTSYGEGLNPAEYWAAAHGARKGTIERAKQTAEPGELSKSLLHSTIDHLITTVDCGTKRGIPMAPSNMEAEDRFLAVAVAGVARNSVITGVVRQKFIRKKIKEITVRSPLTCEAPTGTCALCFGLDEMGKRVAVGTNIGVISGQSITEPTTQMSMNAFHSGGLAGETQLDTFTKVRQLLEFPKNFKNAAVLAKTSGKINNIKPGTAGGFTVTVGEEDHFIPPRIGLTVKKGQAVERGDSLSSGIKNPQEVLVLRGMHEARDYLSQELYDTYKGMGKNIRRKHFEIVAKSVTNSTQVLDPKKDEDFLPGDRAAYNVILAKNRKYAKMVPIDKALGKFPIEPVVGIGVPYAPFNPGDIFSLKKKGVTEIEVATAPIIHKPILRGIELLPKEKRDWLSQLAFRNLKETLKKGVAQGWESDLLGNNPIPSFVRGVGFGQDIKG